MSFFKSLRNSVARGKSSSRDSSLVRGGSSSRSASIDGSNVSRRSSYAQSDSDFENMKPSKKGKNMFGKFNTFTKRRKSPVKQPAPEGFHISLTETYQKLVQPDPVADDPDPFGVLYDKQIIKSDPLLRNDLKADYSTYRKNRLPKQLDELDENDIRNEDSGDKYKTVTLNSYRKSFRDKFLAQQNEVPHNPSWFVEVDEAILQSAKKHDRKSVRPDLLIFQNDDYRPTSRSPVRDNKSPTRSIYRSPERTVQKPQPQSRQIKRTETFKIERGNPEPTIRIEIKNSISPNLPSRIVPLGVAKPFVANNANSRQSRALKPVQQNGRYQTRIQINASTPRNAPTTIHISGKPTAPTIAKTTNLSSYRLIKTADERKPMTHFGDHLSRQKPENNQRMSRSREPNYHNNIRKPSRSPIKIPWR